MSYGVWIGTHDSECEAWVGIDCTCGTGGMSSEDRDSANAVHGTGGSGAASCDSAELAAIRAADDAIRTPSGSLAEYGYGLVYEHRRMLLRMVDELTEERNDALTRAETFYNNVAELKVKLAEAARIHVDAEAKHAYHVKELEARVLELEAELEPVRRMLEETGR